MNAKNCKAIRQQLDEANLDDHLTIEAAEHLRGCVDCRRFNDERRELRRLMAGLETVGAPADFDFRLRARLARADSRNGFGGLLRTARPLALAALVVLIAVSAVMVRRRMSSSQSHEQTSRITSPGSPAERATPSVVVTTESKPLGGNQAQETRVTANGSHEKQPGSRPLPAAVAQRASNSSVRNGGATGTREYSLGAAGVVTPRAAEGALVIVPVDTRVFRLSIDNGHGGARTISLPPVSFGSQRLLARDASFVPVSSVKGDW